VKTPPGQFLVFTGLDGALINSDPDGLQEILPALELLRSRNIPLVASSMRTAADVLPLLKSLDLADPFIVENGGAIYIPDGMLKVEFKHHKRVENYRVIEMGGKRQEILRKLAKLRRDHQFSVTGYSELDPRQAADLGEIGTEAFEAAHAREYSEPILFEGTGEDLQRFQNEIEKQQLRLARYGQAYLVTGDHDEGSAVRLIMQLFREQDPERPVVSVGLGDSELSSPMLHAVDIPILVRRSDGKFDERVGRYGMKFTRNSGPVGWNQAVIAIITEDAEA
jgi:mannosyl-3-phosphoglycerate phosphatase